MKFSLENLLDIKQVIRQLSIGLSRLSFGDNFESFTETGLVIPAGSEARIRNQLNFIPNSRIITRQDAAGEVVDGDTEWDLNYVYLKNTGASPVTVSVVFFK